MYFPTPEESVKMCLTQYETYFLIELGRSLSTHPTGILGSLTYRDFKEIYKDADIGPADIIPSQWSRDKKDNMVRTTVLELYLEMLGWQTNETTVGIYISGFKAI